MVNFLIGKLKLPQFNEPKMTTLIIRHVAILIKLEWQKVNNSFVTLSK